MHVCTHTHTQYIHHAHIHAHTQTHIHHNTYTTHIHACAHTQTIHAKIFVVSNFRVFHRWSINRENVVHENSQFSILKTLGYLWNFKHENADQWLDCKIYIPQKFPHIRYTITRTHAHTHTHTHTHAHTPVQQPQRFGLKHKMKLVNQILDPLCSSDSGFWSSCHHTWQYSKGQHLLWCHDDVITNDVIVTMVDSIEQQRTQFKINVTWWLAFTNKILFCKP